MPGYVVADITALRALDMTGVTETRLRFVTDKNVWYAYASSNSRTDNGEWIIEPTTGGGNWTPTAMIYGTSTPSGGADTPTSYGRVVVGSTGNSVDRIYFNPGGSAFWDSVAIF